MELSGAIEFLLVCSRIALVVWAESPIIAEAIPTIFMI